MQEASINSSHIQPNAFSSSAEIQKSIGFKKATSNFFMTMTTQTENQKEESESDYRGAIDYDDLLSYSKYKIGEDSTEERQKVYIDFAKLLQKKVVAKLALKTAGADLKVEVARKQKIQLQLETLAKKKQLENEQARANVQRQLEDLKKEVYFQQELKKSLRSQLQAWQSLNKATNDQIEQFPQQVKNHLPEMQTFRSSLYNQKQKIVQLFGLQEVFLANIEQIMTEFP